MFVLKIKNSLLLFHTQHPFRRYCWIYCHFVYLSGFGTGSHPQRTVCPFRSSLAGNNTHLVYIVVDWLFSTVCLSSLIPYVYRDITKWESRSLAIVITASAEHRLSDRTTPSYVSTWAWPWSTLSSKHNDERRNQSFNVIDPRSFLPSPRHRRNIYNTALMAFIFSAPPGTRCDVFFLHPPK